jgi:hypothetical protein
MKLLGEGRVEASRHDVILVNGLLANPPLNGFHAVSDRDLEFWANLDEDFVSREYFQLNQHLLTREETMVTRVFVFSRADLHRTEEIVQILRKHQSAGIGWAIIIFEELNPIIGNYQNKPLDFAFITSKGKNKESDKIRAISYFRDYRETSRRYTVVFDTPSKLKIRETRNNGKEIKDQLKLYRSLFAHCWLASASFKELFNNPFLFDDPEDDIRSPEDLRKMVSMANCRLRERLSSLPGHIDNPFTEERLKQNEDQWFLKEVSSVEEISDAIKWLKEVRDAHCEWQRVNISGKSPSTMNSQQA